MLMFFKTFLVVILFIGCCYGNATEIHPYFTNNWLEVDNSLEAKTSEIQLTESENKIHVSYKGRKLGVISLSVMLNSKPEKVKILGRGVAPYHGNRVKFKGNTKLLNNKKEGSYSWKIYKGSEQLGILSAQPYFKSVQLADKTYVGFDLGLRAKINNSWGMVKYRAEWERLGEAGYVFLNTPYGRNRGFSKKSLDSLFESVISKNKNAFSYGQSLNFYALEKNTHFEFNSMPVFLKNAISSASDKYVSENYYLIDDENQIEILISNYFSFKPGSKSDFLLAAQFVRDLQLEKTGLTKPRIVPIAGASVGSQIKKTKSWQALADKVVPEASRLGFKRIWVGQIPTKGQQYPFEYPDKKTAFADLAYYAKAAGKEGLETVLWLETSTANSHSFVAKNNPEWLLVQNDTTYAHYGSKKDVYILHAHEAYVKWFTDNLIELKANTGIDSLWLDSMDLLLSSVDYRDGYPKNRFANGMELIRQADKINFTLYGEAVSPLVISSYWVRKDHFASYDEKEYGLLLSSPYTNRPDSDFVDYFKAASFGAFSVIDIHPFIDGKDIYDNQQLFEEKVKYTNNIVNRIMDNWFDAEYIIDIFDGGAMWASEKELALFFHQDITEIKVKIKGAEVLLTSSLDPNEKAPIVERNKDFISLKNIMKYQVIVLKRNN